MKKNYFFFQEVTFALKQDSTHLNRDNFMDKKTGQFIIKKKIIRQMYKNSYFRFAERVIYHCRDFHLDPVMDSIHLPPQWPINSWPFKMPTDWRPLICLVTMDIRQFMQCCTLLHPYLNISSVETKETELVVQSNKRKWSFGWTSLWRKMMNLRKTRKRGFLHFNWCLKFCEFWQKKNIQTRENHTDWVSQNVTQRYNKSRTTYKYFA